tara:strand:- start:2031 stop:2561 length:531 start_codon:yes stop_codon:yes gene_type:complete
MKKIQEIDNFTHIVSLEKMKREIEYEFNLICSREDLRQLTEKLNVIEAKRANINGILKLKTENEIFLNCMVIAKLIQPCSLTLEPIVTNISKQILRTFYVGSNNNRKENKSVFELTEKSFDNDIIIDEINLGQVLMETISLETPDYPKKSGASVDLTPNESVKIANPFSILSKLKK